MSRIVCWFSCGAASAVATKVALDTYSEMYPDHEVVIASIYLQDEHTDSIRFLKDCERWFGKEILILKDEKYNASVDEVIRKTRYMSGVNGARCTKELKKKVRLDWQKHDDVHVFGMTVDEQHRIDRLIDQENEILLWSPLIDHNITKDDCFKMLDAASIPVPEMYKLGFGNNNCIGCLKASGVGYWNHIRKHFRETYDKRAQQEEDINASLIKLAYKKFSKFHPEVIDAIQKEEEVTGKEILKLSKGQCRIPLRYLPEGYGKLDPIYVGDCGFFCEQGELFDDTL